MINLQKVEFVRSAATAADLPRDGLPQIVFSGRSNAGKSSVINCLLNRKNLAYTGATPGKTIHINLFLLDKQLLFTDLPGYGFAKRSPAERERWAALMQAYFSFQGTKKLGIVIMDIRRDPGTEDFEMLRLLRQIEVPALVLANKADKLKPSQLPARVEAIENALHEKVVVFSAEKGTGRQEVLNLIFHALES